MSNFRDRIVMNKKPIIIGVAVTTALIITTSLIVYLTWPESEEVNNNVIMAIDKFKQNAESARIRGSDTSTDSHTLPQNLLNVAIPVESTKGCTFVPSTSAIKEYTSQNLNFKWIVSSKTINDKSIESIPGYQVPIYHDVYDPKSLPTFKNMVKIPHDLYINWNEILHPMKITYYENENSETILKVYGTSASNYTFGNVVLNNLVIDNTLSEEALTIVLLLKANYLHLKLYFVGENGCRSIEYKSLVGEDYKFTSPPSATFTLVDESETLEKSGVFYGIPLEINTMNNPLALGRLVGDSQVYRSFWPFTYTVLTDNTIKYNLESDEFVEYTRLANANEDKYLIFSIYNGKEEKKKFLGYRMAKHDSTSGDKGYIVDEGSLTGIVSEEEMKTPFGEIKFAGFNGENQEAKPTDSESQPSKEGEVKAPETPSEVPAPEVTEDS